MTKRLTSMERHGGGKVARMRSAKELNRSVLSEWFGKRLEILKGNRARLQSPVNTPEEQSHRHSSSLQKSVVENIHRVGRGNNSFIYELRKYCYRHKVSN